MAGLLQFYFYLVAGLFCYFGIRYALNINKALFDFQKILLTLSKYPPSGKKIFLIIPLLNEEKVFDALVDNFSAVIEKHANLQVVLVTCDKETQKNSSAKNTIELCRQLSKNNNRFRHFHYPSVRGRMAHQVNFGIREIIKQFNPDPMETYISIYNADSNPHRETIEVFEKYCSQVFEREHLYPEAVQQVSTFLLNYQTYNGKWTSSIMKASAFIQTRWSLGYEIEMYRNQTLDTLCRKRLFGYVSPAYCVGHGLFIRLDIMEKFGLLSEKYTNEDLPLGFFLSLSRIPIRVLPILEDSESPQDLRQLIRQKISWYWGMIEHFDYLQDAIKNGYPKFRATLMAFKCHFRDSIPWLLRGPNMIFLLLYPFLTTVSWINISILSASMFCYLALPNRVIINKWPIISRLNGNKQEKPDNREEFTLITGGIAYLIIASAGPLITLLNYLGNKIFGVSKFKPPTAR